MATTEKSDVVPIFSLPNELLMEIFSYITFIPEKMDLERVSKRVRFVSSRPSSWNGVHKLEMMMKCYRANPNVDITCVLFKMKGDCDGEKISLNGIGVPFAKWPAAIKLLLERTNITELIIHCGNDVDLFKSNPTVTPNLMSLLEQYHNKMQLISVELHLEHPASINNDSFSTIEPVKDYFASILITSLKISTLYLKTVVIDIGGDFECSAPQIWPILNECKWLNSILFRCEYGTQVDLKALIGKPLNKVELYSTSSADMTDLIQVINNGTGGGVETLCIEYSVTNLTCKEFCDRLNENSREKLKFLTVVAEMDIRNLSIIFSVFVNLEKMEIGHLWLYDADDIEEFCTMAMSFLTFGNAQSSSPKMVIHRLRMMGDAATLKLNLVPACQNSNVNVEFGESPAEIFLSKGNVAITIEEIEEYDQ